MPDKKRLAARWGRMEWFYYLHVPALLVSAFLLEFEMFTRVSLLYTTTVSAITAGATYGAKAEAASAEVAANGEDP